MRKWTGITKTISETKTVKISIMHVTVESCNGSFVVAVVVTLLDQGKYKFEFQGFSPASEIAANRQCFLSNKAPETFLNVGINKAR